MIEILTNIKEPIDFEEIVNLTFENFKELLKIRSPIHIDIDLRGWKKHKQKRNNLNNNNNNNNLVVAYNQNQLIGFALYRQIQPNDKNNRYLDILKKTPYPFIYNSNIIDVLCVNKDFKRQGFASQIIERVILESKQEGKENIYATCWKGYDGDSILLFNKLNFKQIKFIPNYYFDNSDGIIVSKKI